MCLNSSVKLLNVEVNKNKYPTLYRYALKEFEKLESWINSMHKGSIAEETEQIFKHLENCLNSNEIFNRR